jgi:hypothetical protein
MSSTKIGEVRSGSNKKYDVKWDERSQDVYVSWAGWAHVGKASSAREAMNIAEAWLRER